ncbi:MAG: peroxiredoxin [Sphingobacterium sp.]|jgi:osmotically inducible protein OsmC|nr:peroxiredoxin [Sphingobacterium sp.]
MDIISHVKWKGNIKSGEGELTTGTGLFKNKPYYLIEKKGAANLIPEELLSAAFSSCFNMTLMVLLDCDVYKVYHLNTTCNIDINDRGIIKGHLIIEAKVDHIAIDRFYVLVQKAKEQSPIARILTFPFTTTVVLNQG